MIQAGLRSTCRDSYACTRRCEDAGVLTLATGVHMPSGQAAQICKPEKGLLHTLLVLRGFNLRVIIRHCSPCGTVRFEVESN